MKNCTKIVMVLDRSGSMGSVRDSMEEVLNGYIENQKLQTGECEFTLATFDDQYEVIMNNLPIKQVQRIVLEPRGSTALLDAIGRTIDSVGKELKDKPDAERPNKVLFVIVTDGQENSSQEYVSKSPRNKAERINQMVSHQREVYKWQFIFLGADQDAISSAVGVGIGGQSALNYSNTRRGIRGMGTKLISCTNITRMSNDADEALKSAPMAFASSANNADQDDADAYEAVKAGGLDPKLIYDSRGVAIGIKGKTGPNGCPTGVPGTNCPPPGPVGLPGINAFVKEQEKTVSK